MWALINMIYREYCLARLQEMRSCPSFDEVAQSAAAGIC
jgi:hypothetical protein